MYYIVIITSVIFYIISDIFFAKHSRNSWVLWVNFVRSSILVLLQIPFLFFINFSQINYEIILISLIFWFFGAVYFLSFVYSFKFLPASIATFILSLESVVVILLSYLVYEEKLSWLWFLWAFLLIISWILLSWKKIDFLHLDKRWFLWVFFGIISMFGWAFWWFWFAYISRETSIFIGSFFSQLSIFLWYIFMLVWSKIFLKNFFFTFHISNIKMYITAAIIYGFANILYFYATTLWPISLSILFLSFCPLWVALAWHFFLKEKLQIFQYFLFFVWLIWMIFINL